MYLKRPKRYIRVKKDFRDDIRTFSMVGREAIKKELVNLDQLIKEVLVELQHQGTILPTHLSVSGLKTAQCDGNLIKQVWINLISNAIKYSSKRELPVIDIGIKKGTTDIPIYTLPITALVLI